MTNFIGRLGVTLGLDSAEFTRGIEGAKRGLQAIGQFAQQYAAIAATSFTAATVAAARYADELVDVAKANEVAISSIIQLRDALAKSGGEASNASKFLSSFTQYIDKAAEGSFEAQKTLKSLGISLNDLKTLSVDELFRKAANGLSEMNDSLTRSAKGVDIFGRAFKGVDAKGFGEELNKVTTIAKQHEDGIKAAADAYDNLGEIARRAMEKLAAATGPTFKFITEEYKKLYLENKKLEDSDLWKMMFPQIKYRAGIQEIPKQVTNEPTPEDIAAMANAGAPVTVRRAVKPGIDKEAIEAEKARIAAIIRRFRAEEEARAQLQENQAEQDAYNTQIGLKRIEEEKAFAQKSLQVAFDELQQINQYQIEQAEFEAEQDKKRLLEYEKQLQALNELTKKAALEEARQKEEIQAEQDRYNEQQQQKALEDLKRRQEITTNALRKEAEERAEGEKQIAEQQGEYAKGNKLVVERQKTELDLLTQQKQMLEWTARAREMKAEEFQFVQEVLGITYKYNDAVKQIRENEKLTNQAREEALARQKYLAEEEYQIALRRMRIAQEFQNKSFAEGFTDAMRMSSQNMVTSFEAGQKAFESMMGNMESALNKFVETGKLSFKDFAKSVIADILAIAMKAQLMSMFKGLTSLFMPTPVSLGPNPLAESAPAWLSNFVSIPAAKADGGSVTGNSPYMVGERGPELFVPNRSGTIVPTHQLASMMGSGQTINYNGPFIQQMSAIDTQSGIQFLTQNKQAVWAANQSAQRSLPVSR